MPNNWKTYKLSDIGTIARGKSKNRPRDAAHLYGGEFPFIQTGDVKGANHRLNYHTQTYSKAGLAQSKLWPKNTMCITIAANIAETTILNYPACFPDSIIGFIPDEEKCNIDFVEYMMQHFKKEVQSHSIGSVQDNINLATFERINFLVPPLQEQQAIASILSAIDDKIENNLAINKTLEEMAMALYKHWFVDFGPFQDEEFVESELGMIPKGWEVKKIGNFVIHKKGFAFKSNWYQQTGQIIVRVSDTTHNSIDIKSCERISSVLASNYQEYKLKTNDVVIATVGSWPPNYSSVVGKVIRAPVTAKGALLNQNAVILNMSIDNVLQQGLLYCTLKNERFLKYIVNSAQGSASQASIKLTDIFNYLIPIGKNINIEEFALQIESYISQQNSLIEENQTLTQLRDTLLPRLISGEVRLKEFQEQLATIL